MTIRSLVLAALPPMWNAHIGLVSEPANEGAQVSSRALSFPVPNFASTLFIMIKSVIPVYKSNDKHDSLNGQHQLTESIHISSGFKELSCGQRF